MLLLVAGWIIVLVRGRVMQRHVAKGSSRIGPKIGLEVGVRVRSGKCEKVNYL
jgi:hypothetical protein